MNRTRRHVAISLFASLTAALLFSCAAGVNAGSITVGNSSFEQPPLDNNTYTGGPIPSWTINGSAGPQNFIGSGSYGNGATLPAPGDGSQTAWINSGDIYQDVGALLPHTTYTLTVAAGNQPGYGPLSTGTIELVNGTTDAGTVLGSTLITTQPTSSFADFSVTTLKTGASVSGDLTIVLALTSYQQMDYDNVRLTAVTTPEPASFVLCGLGALGLFIAARRRRRA